MARHGRKQLTRRRRNVLLVAVALIGTWHLLGFVIAAVYLFRGYHNLQPLETPADRRLASHTVTIQVPDSDGTDSSDGADELLLSGWLLPADANSPTYQQGAAVIMLHGFSSSKAKIWEDSSVGYRGSMFDQGAESLVKGGFHVLLLDFRNHGESGDRGTISLGLHEAADVAAALDYLSSASLPDGMQIDRSRIGVRGESMGGAAAIFAAASDKEQRIAALWVDSTFASADRAVSDFLSHAGVPRILMPPVKFWLQTFAGIALEEIRPMSELRRIRCPMMIVHSEDDSMITVSHFHQLRTVAQGFPNIETWLLAGYEHDRLWQDPQYQSKQLEFFRDHLAVNPSASSLDAAESQPSAGGRRE